MTPAERRGYQMELRKVAKRLELPLAGDIEAAIIDHCHVQVERWIAAHRRPETLTELLELLTTCLDMEVVEIHGDHDLQELLARIPPEVEPAVVRIEADLDDETDGITIQRTRCRPWERPFLAVINCRGWHAFRRFFSKWHEVAHLLTEGQQLRFAFRHTRIEELRRAPEEILVDRVAASLAFYPPIFRPVFETEQARTGKFTFDVIDDVRRTIAPEASRLATALACVRHCPDPVYLVRCRMEYKRAERRSLASPQIPLFPGMEPQPQPNLRVVEVAGSPSCARSGVRVHQNMRVPDSSVIARVYSEPLVLNETATDRLDEWETSSGGPIGRGPVEVEAVRFEDEVWALLRFGES